MDIAGVDGCRAGWLCLHKNGTQVAGDVFPTFQRLLEQLSLTTIVAIDIPIGLPTAGERACDRMARQLLGAPRASSVFPARILTVVHETGYRAGCEKHRGVDGRPFATGLCDPSEDPGGERVALEPGWRADRIKEIHPEVSFAEWNGGRAMQHVKVIR